jgi:hypothetical protein
MFLYFFYYFFSPYGSFSLSSSNGSSISSSSNTPSFLSLSPILSSSHSVTIRGIELILCASSLSKEGGGIHVICSEERELMMDSCLLSLCESSKSKVEGEEGRGG